MLNLALAKAGPGEPTDTIAIEALQQTPRGFSAMYTHHNCSSTTEDKNTKYYG